MDEKDLILGLLGKRPIAFYPALVPLSGGVSGAVFLSQLLYWSDKGKDPEGWIYKTQAEWTEETYLSRYEQESVRETLKKSSILEEELKGIPARLFYRINFQKLYEKLLHNGAETRTNTGARKNAENSQTRLRKTSKQGCGKVAGKNAGRPQSNTETTAKNTQEITAESERKALSHETGIYIETQEEMETAKALKDRYGLDTVREVAKEVRILKGRAYLSSVAKLLAINEGSVRGQKMTDGKHSGFDKKDYGKGINKDGSF